MKRIISLILLVLIFSTLLAACNGGGSTFSGVDTSRSSAASGGSTSASSQTESPSGTAESSQPAQSTPGTSEQPGGNIDSEILGGWSDSDGYAYNFKADGTCVLMGMSMSGATGKYYISGGKVYITNIIEHYSQEPLNDKVSDYSFGSDQYGEHIMLKHFSFTDSAPDSNRTYKFYKRS